MVDARTKSVVAPSAATRSAFRLSKGATTRSGAVPLILSISPKPVSALV